MPAVGSLPRSTRLPLRAAAVRAGLREFQLAHPSSWGKWKIALGRVSCAAAAGCKSSFWRVPASNQSSDFSRGSK